MFCLLIRANLVCFGSFLFIFFTCSPSLKKLTSYSAWWRSSHALKMSFCKNQHIPFLVSSCTDLIPNLRYVTLLCTKRFHALSVVLLQSQKFVLWSAFIKTVSVIWGISKHFVLHTKWFLKKCGWLLNRVCWGTWTGSTRLHIWQSVGSNGHANITFSAQQFSCNSVEVPEGNSQFCDPVVGHILVLAFSVSLSSCDFIYLFFSHSDSKGTQAMAFERTKQKDWYQVLGAKPSDSPAELKRKYQKLALLVRLALIFKTHQSHFCKLIR